MLDTKEITRCLLDSDGTTRDVSFTPVTAENLRAFLNAPRSRVRQVVCHSHHGVALQFPHAAHAAMCGETALNRSAN